MTLSRDGTGNLLISLAGKTRGPRWIFAAHMDHPGFVATKMKDARTLEAAFRGWVQIDYIKKARVRFFTDGGAKRESIQLIRAHGATPAGVLIAVSIAGYARLPADAGNAIAARG